MKATINKVWVRWTDVASRTEGKNGKTPSVPEREEDAGRTQMASWAGALLVFAPAFLRSFSFRKRRREESCFYPGQVDTTNITALPKISSIFLKVMLFLLTVSTSLMKLRWVELWQVRMYYIIIVVFGVIVVVVVLLLLILWQWQLSL